MKKLLRNSVYLLAFILLFVCCIVYRQDVSAGVSFGIGYSLSILIPSLFPLMFLGTLISISPAAAPVSNFFSPIMRYVFKLPACAALTVILGLTCGYPVGAKLCAGLLKQGKITEEQASRLMLFVMNPGLPFSMLFVGGVILKDTRIGFYLFLSTALSSLLIGFAAGIKKELPPKNRETSLEPGFNKCMNLAAKSTLSATAGMCLYVVIFSAFMPLLHSLNIYGFFVRLMANPVFIQPENAALFTFIFDVIHGVNDSVKLHAGADVIALGLSFGGLCIHFQIFSFFDSKPVGYIKFYLTRLVHAALTLVIFQSLISLFPRAVGVFSSLNTYTPAVTSGTATGSICLLILSLTYIYMNTGVEKERIL